MEIVRSTEFEVAYTTANDLDVRIRDAIEGVLFIIKRRWDAYPVIPGTSVRIVHFRMFTTMPELRLYYTVDSQPNGDYLCRLLSLRGHSESSPDSSAYL